jgi:hypothetical protein
LAADLVDPSAEPKEDLSAAMMADDLAYMSVDLMADLSAAMMAAWMADS